MGICFRRRRLDTFRAVAARRDAPAQHRSLAPRPRKGGGSQAIQRFDSGSTSAGEGGRAHRGSRNWLGAGRPRRAPMQWMQRRALCPTPFPTFVRHPTDYGGRAAPEAGKPCSSGRPAHGPIFRKPPVGRACPCAPTAGLGKPALHRMCDRSYAREHWALNQQTGISKASTEPGRRRASRFSSPLFCPAPGMLSGPPPGATRASMLSP